MPHCPHHCAIISRKYDPASILDELWHYFIILMAEVTYVGDSFMLLTFSTACSSAKPTWQPKARRVL